MLMAETRVTGMALNARSSELPSVITSTQVTDASGNRLDTEASIMQMPDLLRDLSRRKHQGADGLAGRMDRHVHADVDRAISLLPARSPDRDLPRHVREDSRRASGDSWPRVCGRAVNTP